MLVVFVLFKRIGDSIFARGGQIGWFAQVVGFFGVKWGCTVFVGWGGLALFYRITNLKPDFGTQDLKIVFGMTMGLVFAFHIIQLIKWLWTLGVKKISVNPSVEEYKTKLLNEKLINILIVIAVLVGLYYWISPYQNCYREFKKEYPKEANIESRFACGKFHSW
jgi:hypothetical protein